MKKKFISVLVTFILLFCMIYFNCIKVKALPIFTPGYDNENVTITVKTSKVMEFKSSATNNILQFIEFDVKNNEMLIFDDKNYLIIIDSDSMSKIEGSIIGQGNLYIINPNGCLFTSTSSVEVKGLLVSTASFSTIDEHMFKAGLDPFEGSESSRGGDVIFLGSLIADEVNLDGKEVYFSDNVLENMPINGIVVNDEHYELPVSESIFSNGNIWIIICSTFVIIIVVISIIVIVNKKKIKNKEITENKEE